MKKVLILAYDFPPYISVGGLRPYSWYNYLNESNIYPIVITRQWSNSFGNYLDYIAPGVSSENIVEETEKGMIIRTPYIQNFANQLMLKHGNVKYKFIRRAITAYYEFAQFLFLTGPKSSIYAAAHEYLKKNKVDVIIATGDPFILFKYASKLSKKFKTPWISDYRDLWSQETDIQNNFILKYWNTYFEKKIVKSSSLILTVSDFLKLKISSLIKHKKYKIIPNGYDPEAISNIKNIGQQTEFLSFAFVGTLYDWHPIRSFLSVFSSFIKTHPDSKIKIYFYGINFYCEDKYSNFNEFILAEFPHLKDHMEIYKKMSNEDLLKELAKQNVMLLFNDYSLLGTKIFDYLGIGRTILFCYANDPEANLLKKKHHVVKEEDEANNKLQEELINKTTAGYIIQDAKHLYKTLELLYDEFQKNGSIKCTTVNIENYSRKHRVKELAEIIEIISSENKN
jgi:glycosyltransferase involved in cell wall biosynthesis